MEGTCTRTWCAGFQNPLISGFYIVAMILLCMHLYHGLFSMFQSLGVNHPNYTPLLKRFAAVMAILIAVGNISIPVAVLAGLVRMKLESKIPSGPIEKAWEKARFDMKLVNPANKRKYNVMVVGSGLAGGVRRGFAGRARLQRQVLLFSGQPAARA